MAFCVACASAPTRISSAIPPVSGEPHDLSGIRVVDITLGTGTPYAPHKCIYTHYTGWLTDGTMFESSRDTIPGEEPKDPVVFEQGAKRVMTGWDVGFEGMRVGGKRRLFIPYHLGYGGKGNPPAIPARADLIFDVELMAIADLLPRDAWSSSAASGTPCPAWSTVRNSR
jgi:peptidylprolyl isomerase